MKQVQMFAAQCIQNLAANKTTWPDLVRNGAIPALLDLLRNDKAVELTRLYAVAAAQSLSVDDRIKLLLMEEGFLEVFIHKATEAILQPVDKIKMADDDAGNQTRRTIKLQVEMCALLANVVTLQVTSTPLTSIKRPPA